MIMKNLRQHKGFTLVESMVAISILSLAVTGPLLIAQKGIGSAIYARDQITAFYLAQEAIEYNRNVRDSNRIAGNGWLNQFNNCKEVGGSPKKCQIDARYVDFDSPGAIGLCPAGDCPKLSRDTVNNIYGYGTGEDWEETMFTRTISIDDRADPKEALISVTISWNTNLFLPARTFTVREYIFDF